MIEDVGALEVVKMPVMDEVLEMLDDWRADERPNLIDRPGAAIAAKNTIQFAFMFTGVVCPRVPCGDQSWRIEIVLESRMGRSYLYIIVTIRRALLQIGR